MARAFSIAQARHNLAALVHDLERQPFIQLTRRGKPVAVLLSLGEYQRLTAARFWDAYTAFRTTTDLAKLEIHPNLFNGLRDKSSGREMRW